MSRMRGKWYRYPRILHKAKTVIQRLYEKKDALCGLLVAVKGNTHKDVFVLVANMQDENACARRLSQVRGAVNTISTVHETVGDPLGG
ncbi:hypothetical protein CEXT_199831 [Caerostris extrusa]|uniref:Uncharacterized protein n=1 Tax=Caerostris extrusa TaxID=172846 RepID=A0AAV4QH02_CAEEX|nr:hypothetical protein CEXT_199831 [Caerostris extrusa]